MDVGSIIDDKYELIRRIASGGMGVVYEGRHRQIGRRVAIKLLHSDMVGKAEIVERFFNEARTATAIGSEHIVEITDMGHSPEGIPYLVMEYVEGESLGHYIARKSPLEPSVAAEIALQLCEALAPAHRQGIVHRDLKPENILLTQRAGHSLWVKILDFGIAKVRDAARGEDCGLTQTGATFGTPYYMSPEQFRRTRDVDQRADVYSAGVILYELLTANRPFTGESYEEILLKVVTSVPKQPILLKDDLPPALSDVLMTAMAKEPHDRYQSMDEMAKALIPFAGRQPIASIVPPSVSPPTVVTSITETSLTPPPTAVSPFSPTSLMHNVQPFYRRRTPLTVAAVTVLVIVGLSVFLNWGPTNRTDDDGITESDAPLTASLLQPSTEENIADESTESEPLNRWIAIEPAPNSLVLGLPSHAVSEKVRGFRPGRSVTAPTYPFEIQQHEVTWAEFRPWLELNPDHQFVRPSWLSALQDDRFPVTGMTWDTALAYCRSIGGSLPTEEEWEFAARGRGLRPNPWGTAPLDLARTNAFGPVRPLKQVMESEQDVTPGSLEKAIHDLVGNAREWTASLYRLDEPVPPEEEAWVQAGGRSFRVVRGLPPTEEPPVPLPAYSAAYRRPLCATGPCAVNDEQERRYRETLQFVGFRCSRRVAR